MHHILALCLPTLEVEKRGLPLDLSSTSISFQSQNTVEVIRAARRVCRVGKDMFQTGQRDVQDGSQGNTTPATNWL